MEVRNINSQNQSSQNMGGRIVNNGNAAGNVPVTRAVSTSMLANMQKGSIFSGDVIDVRNSFIKILLDGNQTITAKSGDNSNLNIGDYIKFMVKENTGDQIYIKALNVDNSHTNPLVLALKSANIPVTSDNMKMISEMMRNEMPIDKNSVNEMYKNVSMFEKGDPKTIVNLVRHEIPLNEANITQFEKYVNYEHRLNYELSNIADIIPDAMKNISKGDIQATRNIFNELLADLPDLAESNNSINFAADEDVFEILANESDIIKNDNIENNENEIKASNQNIYDNIIENDNVSANSKLVDISNAINSLIDKLSDGIDENSINQIIKDIVTGSNEEQIEINDLMNFENFKIPNKEFLLKLGNALDDNQFTSFIKNEKVTKFLKTGMIKNFLLDVNRLSKNGNDIKENIKNIYDKLDKQIKQLEETFKGFPKEAASILEKTNSLKQNLSFMNEINQMASYVQLPLKFSESTNHGDLYVYNKNHGKVVDKDILTAFMHLDMDNLGSTDVDIKLEGSKLSTNFSLVDDLSAKIVEEHLDELKEKLTLAGFNVTLNVTVDDKPNDNPFEKVLEVDRPKLAIKRFSFDVRA